jgi:hypothetical protein
MRLRAFGPLLRLAQGARNRRRETVVRHSGPEGAALWSPQQTKILLRSSVATAPANRPTRDQQPVLNCTMPAFGASVPRDSARRPRLHGPRVRRARLDGRRLRAFGSEELGCRGSSSRPRAGGSPSRVRIAPLTQPSGWSGAVTQPDAGSAGAASQHGSVTRMTSRCARCPDAAAADSSRQSAGVRDASADNREREFPSDRSVTSRVNITVKRIWTCPTTIVVRRRPPRRSRRRRRATPQP